MVLDKLSDSLKETLKKITKAVFVDERLINDNGSARCQRNRGGHFLRKVLRTPAT